MDPDLTVPAGVTATSTARVDYDWIVMTVNGRKMRGLTPSAAEKFIREEEAQRQHKGLKLRPEARKHRKEVRATPPLPSQQHTRARLTRSRCACSLHWA